jgi:hypothetical protein
MIHALLRMLPLSAVRDAWFGLRTPDGHET